MTDFGAFVELEPGVDALLHVSQISRERIEKPSSVLSVGQEVEVKVVDIKPEDRKISLSMKALLPEIETPAEEENEDAYVDEAPADEAAEAAVEEKVEEAPVTEEAEEAVEETPAAEEAPAEEE